MIQIQILLEFHLVKPIFLIRTNCSWLGRSGRLDFIIISIMITIIFIYTISFIHIHFQVCIVECKDLVGLRYNSLLMAITIDYLWCLITQLLLKPISKQILVGAKCWSVVALRKLGRWFILNEHFTRESGSLPWLLLGRRMQQWIVRPIIKKICG
jgi:hypothetical protein